MSSRHSSPYSCKAINTEVRYTLERIMLPLSYAIDMYTRALLLHLLICVGLSSAAFQPLRKPPNQWIVGLRNLLQDCPIKSAKVQKDLTPSLKFVRTLADCARSRALMAIDDILEDDVIPLINGLELVKLKDGDGGLAAGDEPPLNASVTFNIRQLLRRIRAKDQVGDTKDNNWREIITSRLSRVLRTHVIKIDIERLGPTIPDVTTDGNGRSAGLQIESRGRRRRRRQMQMMPIIMMGVLLMGTVLIPMGFQFLAVLGGKALILAKMALMLSSIQGLKKVATNGVNYGLYHTQVPEVWHERSTGAQNYEIPYVAAAAAAAAGGGGGLHGGHGYLDGLGHFSGRSAVQPT